MTTSDARIEIPGYRVEDELGRGATSVVYRAVRDGSVFALKIARPTNGAPSDQFLRFAREGATLARLDDPALVKVFEVGTHDGVPFLVAELVSGTKLSDLLARGPLSPARAAAVARRIATALSRVHAIGLVHRDVKPGNVLIDEHGDARLVDFGFVARAEPRAREDVAFTGTLQYGAPEQIGVLRHAVDGRADLYSLGVVLFEALTGRLPFEARDAAELVAEHASRPAPRVSELAPSVPRALEAIVAKLLAKDPDERYVDAAALLRDLDRVHAGAGDHGAEPRAAEASDPPADEAPFVARGAERDLIVAEWEKARSGEGRVVLLRGGAAVGKTRLIREAARAIEGAGGAVLSARGSGAHARPFDAFRRMLEAMLAVSERDPGADAAAARLRAATAAHAPWLASFSPKLGTLHPGQTPAAATREQTCRGLVEITFELARELGGAALLVDDLGDLDDASVDVLARVVASVETSPLVVVVTRTDEPRPDTAESVRRIVGSAPAGRQTDVVLGPFDDGATRALLVALLRGEVEHAFVQHVISCTHGSPLAIGEYVRAALEAGLLRPSWGTWIADRAGLASIELPSNTAELVARRIGELDETTRRVLVLAALGGPRFVAEDLVAACREPPGSRLWAPAVGGTPGRVHAALADARRLRLVDVDADGRCDFVHATIPAALLAPLDAAALRELHQRWAESLDDGREDVTPERLTAIARHYLAGATDRAPERVVDRALRAGLSALDDFATSDAYAFLRGAADVARAAGLPANADLHRALGEAALRRNEIAEAVGELRTAVELTTSPVARAKLRERLARVFLSQYDPNGALPELERAFRDLGVDPAGSSDAGAAPPRGASGELGAEEAARLRTCVEVYDCATMTTAMAADLDRALRYARAALRPARRLRRSRHLVLAYMNYAFANGAFVRPRTALEYGRRAVEVASGLGDRGLLAKSQLYRATAAAFCGDERRSEEQLLECLEQHGRWLDADGFIVTCGVLTSGYVIRGYAREAHAWTVKMIDRLRAAGRGGRDHALLGYGGAALAMMGSFSEAADLLRRAQAAANRLDTYVWGNVVNSRILYQLERGETGAVIDEVIAERRALPLPPPEKALHYARFFYVYQAHARIAQCLRAPRADRAPALARLEEALDELRRGARVATLDAHLYAVEANAAWLRGDAAAGRRWADRAERLAHRLDHPWALFEAHMARARIDREAGREREATRDARIAHGIATDQGWTSRAHAVETEFEIDASATFRELPAKEDTSATTVGKDALRERYMHVLAELSRASSHVFDAAEHARICLDRLVHLLGAERAYLFLSREGDGELVFEAARDREGKDVEELRGYSTTVLERVRRSRRPVIVSGTDEGKLLGSRSVVANNLRSIIAAPLLLRDTLLGVICLDSRVTAGMFSTADLEVLHGVGQHIALAIERTRAAEVEIERAALEKDLALTAAVQSLILPKTASIAGPGWRLAGFHESATIAGGDWWWYETQPDGGVIVLLADVTGHGAGAAMVTAIVASCYEAVRAVAGDRLVLDRLRTLDEVLTRLCGSQYGTTISCAHVSADRERLRWLNAGGPPLIVMSAEGKTQFTLAPGAGLGNGAAQFGEKTVALSPGDRVVLFTDGCVEIPTANGRQFGLRGLGELVRRSLGTTTEECRTAIAAGLAAARGSAPRDDDMTFVVFDRD